MKNVYEVLRRKEADLTRIRREVDSLKITASLLADERNSDFVETSDENSTEESSDPHDDPQATGTDHLFSYAGDSGSKFWNVLKRGK